MTIYFSHFGYPHIKQSIKNVDSYFRKNKALFQILKSKIYYILNELPKSN